MKYSSRPAWDGRVAQSKLRQIILDFVDQKTRIMGDTAYTVEGKAAKVAKLGRTILKQIEELKPITLDRIEKRFRAAQEAFTTKAGDNMEGDLVAAVKEVEARRLLLQMKDSERVKILQRAVDQRDTATLRAFFNCPSFVPILNRKVLDTAKTAWLEQQNPELAAELKSAQGLYEVVQENFESVTNDITTEAGLDRDLRGRLKAAYPTEES